jgi:Transglutaminase-like superfamily
MTQEDLLAFYRSPGLFTDLDGFEGEVEGLPCDVAVARTVQGLLIQEGLIGAYGVSLPAERIAEKQLHSSVAMLARAMSLDSQAIVSPRVPERRVVGVCRHFATLFVAIMRLKGLPARAHCGSANYFAPGKHLDHWVGEYWNAMEGRWVLVDAQIDDRQRELFRVTLDRLDVPRDRFLVAGDAWRACRNGADPMTFGVAGTEMWGLVEVYGDLFQDLAALQNIELLPWGWYGLATDKSGIGETALIDRLAGISSSADAQAFEELRSMIAEDDRLRPPGSQSSPD